jgi:hypothetical protein
MRSLSQPIVELCKLLIALGVTRVLHQINGREPRTLRIRLLPALRIRTRAKSGETPLQRWRLCDVFVC